MGWGAAGSSMEGNWGQGLEGGPRAGSGCRVVCTLRCKQQGKRAHAHTLPLCTRLRGYLQHQDGAVHHGGDKQRQEDDGDGGNHCSSSRGGEGEVGRHTQAQSEVGFPRDRRWRAPSGVPELLLPSARLLPPACARSPRRARPQLTVGADPEEEAPDEAQLLPVLHLVLEGLGRVEVNLWRGGGGAGRGGERRGGAVGGLQVGGRKCVEIRLWRGGRRTGERGQKSSWSKGACAPVPLSTTQRHDSAMTQSLPEHLAAAAAAAPTNSPTTSTYRWLSAPGPSSSTAWPPTVPSPPAPAAPAGPPAAGAPPGSADTSWCPCSKMSFSFWMVSW